MNANPGTSNFKRYFFLFVAGVISALVIMYKVNAIGEDKKVTTHRYQLYKSCVEDAGNYVFRKVEGVEAVAQLRLREWAGHGDWKSRSEYPYDMYGYNSFEIRHVEFSYVNPPFSNYKYFESPLLTDNFKFPPLYASDGHLPAVLFDTNPKYRRFSGYRQRESKMKVEHVSTLLSLYGFTFQETHTEGDDAYGVIGSDLIVVDIATGEILGLRKGYWSTEDVNTSPICPFGRDWSRTVNFVSRVLISETNKGMKQ